MDKKLNLTASEIIEIQKELCELRVLEEYKDYKITEDYLNDFLKKYSDLSREYGYIQGAILLQLFRRIREKNPNILERDVVEKAHKLFPIIRAMLDYQKVFKLIKQVSKKSDGKIKKELEEMDKNGFK